MEKILKILAIVFLVGSLLVTLTGVVALAQYALTGSSFLSLDDLLRLAAALVAMAIPAGICGTIAILMYK